LTKQTHICVALGFRFYKNQQYGAVKGLMMNQFRKLEAYLYFNYFEKYNPPREFHVNDKVINSIARTGIWFVPVPKTGTQSIRYFLYRNFGRTFAHEGPLRGHKTALHYQDLFGQHMWENLFSFGFTRNPWDRMVSLYHYQNPDNKIHFKDWIDKPQPEYLSRETSAYLCDKNNNKTVKFIGRFESLKQDFNEICQKLQIKDQHLIKKNVSSRDRDYRKYYSNETAEIVRNRFKRDIENFGYKF